MFRRAIAVLVCALAFATPGLAQEQRGSLEGTVKDAQGAVLPGAVVEARSAALIGVRSETADASGNYRFPALPPGTYQVTAALSGFQTTKSQIVQLSVGQVLRVDVTLPLGGVTEAVQVTAESTVLDVASARTATTLTARVIEELPRGRTFNTLLQLAPGVRAESKSGSVGVGGYQFDGTSGSENVFVVDGVDVSNIRNGSLGVQDAIDSACGAGGGRHRIRGRQLPAGSLQRHPVRVLRGARGPVHEPDLRVHARRPARQGQAAVLRGLLARALPD